MSRNWQEWIKKSAKLKKRKKERKTWDSLLLDGLLSMFSWVQGSISSGQVLFPGFPKCQKSVSWLPGRRKRRSWIRYCRRWTLSLQALGSDTPISICPIEIKKIFFLHLNQGSVKRKKSVCHAFQGFFDTLKDVLLIYSFTHSLTHGLTYLWVCRWVGQDCKISPS